MHWVERWDEPSFDTLLTACEDEVGLVVLDSSSSASASSRYSYVCIAPFASFQIKSGQAIWNETILLEGCPWAQLKKQLQSYTLAHDPDLPPFQGGVAGYWGYELAHTLESFPKTHDFIQFADCVLYFYSSVVAYDHKKREVILMATGMPASGLSEREKQARADLVHTT